MKQRQRKAGRKQQGFTALETLIVLIVATLVATTVPPLYGRYIDGQSNRVAGEQMRAVADAAAQYIKDNYAVVVANATPSVPAIITTAMLRSAGYLQPGFSDLNAYGQGYRVMVLEPTPNKLQTLIVTQNGEVIKGMSLLSIAKQIGAKGGYVSADNPNVATGSFGGWTTTLAPYGVAPGAGHLATALFFEDGALVNDYLYRHAVPGKPELQQMHAAIDMRGNNLNNAGTVNAATAAITGNASVAGTLSAGQANITGNARVAGETYTGGWFRSRNDSGWYNETHSGGWYMTDPTWVRSYADKGIYTGGEVRAGKLTSTGRTEIGEFLQLNGIAVEGAACTPNGLVGRNAAGSTLSCQSGVWKGSGAAEFLVTNCVEHNWQRCTPVCPSGYTLQSHSGVSGKASNYFHDRYYGVGVCVK